MDQKKKNRLTGIVIIGCAALLYTGMFAGLRYYDPPLFNKMKNDVIKTIGGNYAHNYFTRSLKKKKVYERSQAAERLGELGRKEAVPHLKLVLQDSFEDMQVKKSAAVSIRRIIPNQYSKDNLGDSINKDRESLVAKIAGTLDNLSHTGRIKETGEYADLYEKNVRNYTKEFYKLNEEKKLEIIELNIISKLLDELKRKETLSKLGELVNADLQNGDTKLEGVRTDGTYGHYIIEASKTELGGLVKIVEKESGKRLVFESHEPDTLLSNETYSQNDRSKIDDAVCNFHFHAIDKKGNPEFAGPSFIFGDLSSASLSSRDGLVITYLGTDKQNNIRINVDYYTRSWVVVDLGNYNTGVKLDKNIKDVIIIDFDAEIPDSEIASAPG